MTNVWCRVRLVAVLVAIAAGSAVLTSGLARSNPQPTLVATASGVPMLLPESPPPASTPNAGGTHALITTHGVCVNVPIVYYHYIRTYVNPRDVLGERLSVSPQEFRAQMDWLREAGVHPVTLAQVMAAINGGPALPPQPIVLTFDDGYSDFATSAVPVLLREGFVATAFVVPGYLGEGMYMSDQQVIQVANEGMVIGAHTMHHVDLNVDSVQLAKIEIDTSRSVLQTLTGRPVLDFAYPYGHYDPTIVGLVAEAGFRDAVATTWGAEQCESNRFELHRIEVLGPSTVWSFARAAGLPVPPPGWTDPRLPLSPSLSSLAGLSRHGCTGSCT